MTNRLTRLDSRAPTPLYPTGVEVLPGMPQARISKAALVFACLAWIATLALAFMLGRASVAPILEVAPATTPLGRAQVEESAESVVTRESKAPARVVKSAVESGYPHLVSTIPTAFRGAWDEIVTDRCFGREPRYLLTATTLTNFEVSTDVERVKLISPTEIELSVTGYDENKNQFNDTVGFRLLDNGKTLAGADPESNFYRRCPR